MVQPVQSMQCARCRVDRCNRLIRLSLSLCQASLSHSLLPSRLSSRQRTASTCVGSSHSAPYWLITRLTRCGRHFTAPCCRPPILPSNLSSPSALVQYCRLAMASYRSLQMCSQLSMLSLHCQRVTARQRCGRHRLLHHCGTRHPPHATGLQSAYPLSPAPALSASTSTRRPQCSSYLALAPPP